MKQKQCYAGIRNLLRLTCIFSFLLLFGQQLQAQDSLTTTTVVPTNPTNYLNVGVNSAVFTTRITNPLPSSVSISTITLQLPAGVSLVSGSVFIVTNGDTVPFNPSTNNQLLLNNYSLPSMSSIVVIYSEKAGCGAVPTATSSFSIKVLTHINIQYVYNGLTHTKKDSTNSYPIIFPGLSFEIPASPANQKAVQWRVPFNDTITVTNASSAGKAKNMLFSMNWGVAGALQINSMSLLGPNGTPVGISLSSITLQGDSTFFSIDSSLLAQMGFVAGIFNASNSFKVLFSATPLQYASSLQTVYSAYYLADSSNCKLLSNATGIMDYTQEYPAPNPTIILTNVQLANWCGTAYSADVVLQNAAADNSVSNDLLDGYLTINGVYNSSTLSVQIGGVDLTDDNGKWYLPATDLDGDSIISDFVSGHSVTVHVSVQPDASSVGSYIEFSFYGNKIDGNSTNNSYYVGGFDYAQSSINSPSDANAGDAVNYIYTYSAQGRNLSESAIYGFLDISDIRVYSDAIGAPVYSGATGASLNLATQSWSLSGTQPFSATATCGMSQGVSLQVATSGCSDIWNTITSATGNTQVQCRTMGAGDCYGIYTNDVSIDENITTMNTCSTIKIAATGEVDHWCDNKKLGISCPPLTQLIARVYDLSGALTFIAGDASVSGAVSGVMTPSNSYATNHGIAWIGGNLQKVNCNDSVLNIDNFNFNATFKINGDHSLQDINNVNLRVEFAFIDSAGTLDERGWSKGVAITVYDPKPTFHKDDAIITCTGIPLSASMSAGAPGVTTTAVTIDNIFYPAVDGYYYPSNASPTYETGISTNNSNKVIIPAGSSQDITMPCYPRCVVNGANVTANPFQVTYTDSYTSGCVATQLTTPVWTQDGPVAMPTIVLHPAKLQQTLTNTATWTVQVENAGSADAGDVMVKLNVDPTNKIAMLIDSINGKAVSLSTTQYVDLGSIFAGKETALTVTAQYQNCTNSSDTNHIFVTGAWSCDALSQSNFNYFNCNNSISTVLQLENMAAVLNAVEKYPADSISYGLCENIPIKVNINNIGRANLDSLGFWIDSLPKNMTLIGNQVNWNFNNKVGTIVNNLSSSPKVNLYASNYLLSQKILSPATNQLSSSALHSTDSTIHLGFNVQVHCSTGKDSITQLQPLTFETQGTSNCGDIQSKTFSYLPQLAGFEHLKDLVVSAVGGAFSGNMGSSTITAKVKNTSSVFVDSAYITVVLPAGIAYKSYTAATGTFVTGVSTTPNTDGSNTVQFELTKEKNIAAGDSVSITFGVTDTYSCPPTSSVAQVMGTLKRRMIDCDKSTCMVEASTAATSVNLTRPQAAFSPTITGTSVVCAGTSANYLVAGSDVGSVLWSVSPATESISGNGKSATAIYGNAETATVTASVTAASCVNNTVSVSTNTQVNKASVNIVPTAQTICAGQSVGLSANGAISYSWSNSNSAAAQTVTPSSTTTYSVTGTDGNGCIASASSTVTVNPIPVLIISPASSTICIGTSTTLNASGADSYTWSDGTSGAVLQVSPSVTSTYSVTGVTAGCSASATSTITVNSAPSVNVTAAPQTICPGFSTVLTASGADSYTWSTGAVGTAINVSPTTNTTYTVTGTSGNCSAQAATTITVNDIPATPVITAIPSSVTFYSSPYQLAAQPAGGVFSGVGVTNGILYPNQTSCGVDNGITYTVSNSCGTASATTTVNFACCAIGTIQGLDTVCAGDTLTNHLYTVTGANMPVTWSLINPWMNVLTPSGNSVSLQFKYGQSQSLQLVATAGLGCADTLSIFSVNTPGIGSAVSDTITLCRLSSISYGIAVSPDVWPIHLLFYSSAGDTITNTVLLGSSNSEEMYALPTIDSSSFTKKYYIRINDNHCLNYSDSLLVLRHAAPDAWFETSSSCVGDTVTMKLYARDLNNCGITKYGLNLKYNTDSLTYVSYSMANSIAPRYGYVGVTTTQGNTNIEVDMRNNEYTIIPNTPSLLMTLKFVTNQQGSINVKLDSLTFCGIPKMNLYDSVITIGKPATLATSIIGRDTLCWNTQNEPYSIATGGDVPASWILDPVSAGTMTAQGGSASVSIASGFSGNVTLQALYNATACSPANTLSKIITVLKQPSITNYNRDTLWECLLAAGNQSLGYYITPDTDIQYTIWDASHTVISNTQYFNYNSATTQNQVDKYTFEISHRLCPLPTIYDSLYLARYPVPTATASAAPVCQSDTLRVAVKFGDIHKCQFLDIGFDALFDISKYQFAGLALNDSLLSSDHTVTATPIAGGQNVHIQIHDMGLFIPVSSQTLATILFVPLQAGTSVMSIGNTVYNVDGTYKDNNSQIQVPITIYPNPVVSIPNGSVCSGSLFTLVPNVTSGTTPYTYLWSNNKTTASNQVSAGNYMLIVTDAHSCKAVATATVSQSQPPAISVSASPSTMCAGLASTITATGGTTYVWNTTASNAASITVTPTSNTTYTVTGTDANGCTNTATTAVSVNALPTLTASSSPTAVCVGNTATVSVAGASTYAWNNGLGTGASKIVTPATTTTYTVTGTSVAGCVNIATTVVTVNSLPTLSATSSPTAVCVGNTATVSVAGASTYAWNNGLGTGASKTVTPATTTTYTVTGTSTAGCVNKATTTVTVNSLPTLTASSSPTAVCVGNTATVSVAGASTYAWNNSLGAGASKTVTPATTTTYTVTGTNANGCKNTATTAVSVNPLPTINAGSAVAICSGTATTLTATGGATYKWSNGITVATNTVSPTATTTYTVTGTNASSCSATGSVVVTVNPLPTVTVNSGALNNGSFTLTATATGKTPLGYAWSNTAVNSNTNTVTLPGTYTVTVSDGNGCKASASGTVMLLSSVVNVCAPQTGVNLNAGNFASYVWTGPGLAANTTWNPVWVTATGTYYVTATAATTGLKYTSSTTVTIHPAYNPTITSNVNGVYTTVTNGVVENCPGTQFNLTANSGEAQYIWNGITGTANYVTATTVTSTINLTEVDNNGCSSNTEYVNLEYYTVSPAVISQTAILTGTNSVTLTSSSGSTVTWSTGATTNSINITKAGTYTVTVTDGDGCKSVSSVTEVLNISPLSISKQSEPSGIDLVAQPSGLNEYYQWYNVNAPTQILGGGNTLNVTTAGIYGITAYINGTKIASTTDTVVLNTSTNLLKNEVVTENASSTEPEIISTPESDAKATVSVIPQPAKNEVTVVSTSPVRTVVMYDMNGKVVVSVKNTTVINVSILPAATYQMIIETEAGVFSKTVVVIR